MKKGFTLIELLVVIIILGTLAALLVANFMSARERARDAQRRQDLKQIKMALEMYRQDQSPPSFTAVLPDPGDCWSAEASVPVPTTAPTSSPDGGGGGDVSGETCSGNVYMNRVPGDPNRTPSSYYYLRSATDYLKYTLCACLENKADPDAENGDCDSLTYICNSQKKYVLSEN